MKVSSARWRASSWASVRCSGWSAAHTRAAELVIPTGKYRGRHPSVAGVYRVLADGEAVAGVQ